jgi:hypothetical protein
MEIEQLRQMRRSYLGIEEFRHMDGFSQMRNFQRQEIDWLEGIMKEAV